MIRQLRASKHRHPLSYRLLLYVFLCSLAFTFLATAVQMYTGYRQEMAAVYNNIEFIEDNYALPIAASVYNVDDEQLGLLLQGALQLPGIVFLEVTEQRGEQEFRLETGDPASSQDVIREVPLVYAWPAGESIDVGMLRITASMGIVYEQLQSRLLITLVTNGIETFLTSLVILFIVRFLVIRHLVTMANYAQNLNLNKLDQALRLNRGSEQFFRPDELDYLEAATNDMRVRLQEGINKREQVEAALRESQEQLRSVLDTIPDFILTLDRDGLIRFINRTYTSFTIDQVIGTTILDWLPADYHDSCKQMLADAFDTGEYREQEMTAPGEDGLPAWYLTRVGPVIKNDTVVALTMVGQNITDRKQAEEKIRNLNAELEARVAQRTAQLEATNKELEAFAYSVSHDLRAPLRAINGFSQILQEDYSDNLEADGLFYLQKVRTNATHMGQLIDDLLRLSRLTRAEMRYETVDLSAMATTIIRELRDSAPERQVDVMIWPELIAQGDTAMLKVAMQNLLNNAWKYTSHHDSAQIEFGVEGRDGVQTFFVRDDGAGFDMAYVDKLFGAFQRLHRADEFPGTGIGLATVQRIIHRHGGRIWAEAAKEQGATFYFVL